MEKSKQDFFGEKKYLSRIELRQKLRKAPSRLSDSGRRYTRQEREAFEKKFDFKKYGPNIDRKDVKGLIRGLQKERRVVKWEKRREINNDINYLKKLGDF